MQKLMRMDGHSINTLTIVITAIISTWPFDKPNGEF
jgi:hypothetical protein